MTSADGTPIVINQVGHGPDVVLIHGGMDDATSWLPVASSLASWGFRCWLPHRRRADTGQHYSIDREIDDLAAVLSLADGAARVIGHSYGAVIVLRALLRTPALPIKTAVLYEPPLTAGGPIVGDLLAPIADASAAGDHAAALLIYLRDVAGFTPELAEQHARCAWLQHQVPALLPEIEVADRLAWTPDIYAGITVPTMLLLGERSAPHPNRDSTLALAETLPAAHLVGMPQHGHLANRRDPTYVAALIRSYLADPGHSSAAVAP
ncbi:alpha/beta fold hydrolase [Amycolatopsis azurea]|uniref:alpha/beta fold hydrolase n=1 Tax=Amycolatopsis azurea TaxID=36819 RepID=UPI00382C0345